MDNSDTFSSPKKVVSHQRTIIHIDMDCFYAQVEEIRDPSLRSKPLGIQQKNIVVTSNYVAREYGIKKLMLISEAKKLCPHLVLVNGEDLTYYRQMSNNIFEILHKYTPLVEKLGFDENFLDVTSIVNQRLQSNSTVFPDVHGCIYPVDGDLSNCSCGCSTRLAIGTQIAKEIRQELNRTLAITCCAGISYNKLLAKLIGSQNKPNNQTVLVSNYCEQFMRELNCLNKITGIGQKSESLLLESGIGNISDLQNCSMNQLKIKHSQEIAIKLKDLSFGYDFTPVRPTGKPKTIGLEDSCRPISVRRDVEERFRTLLIRLLSQVTEDGRIPIAIKIILRKFDPIKKTSHKETKQANITPSLFNQRSNGQITLNDGSQETILKIIMRLFERIVDMKKSFNITLLGLAFSKFQERKNGATSIANFLIKKTDIEVQSITNLSNEEKLPTQTFGSFDQLYRRQTTASPIPMHIDVESIPSDMSDFSENEIEPSPKKSRFGFLSAKRRCIQNGESDVASPSKLRVADLRLNSRDSDKELLVAPSVSSNVFQVTSLRTSNIQNCDNNKPDLHDEQLRNESEEISMERVNCWNSTDSTNNENTIITPVTKLTGTLSTVPCPAGVDPNVFKELPLDVQNELISSWTNSIAVKASSTTSATSTSSTTGPTTKAGSGSGAPSGTKNTLYRYFIRNK